MAKRKRFTTEFKAKVVLEALSGETTHQFFLRSYRRQKSCLQYDSLGVGQLR